MESVLTQIFSNIEYIVVDGNSKDNTVAIIKEIEPFFKGRMHWISEPDKGIYDAMNKGIKMATGEIIGILNSDDIYTSTTIISDVASAFVRNDIGAVFGDLHYFKGKDTLKSYRKYSGKFFRPWMFRWGFMPPHPSFFVRKEFYDKWGTYDSSFDISGDYELMVRFLYVKKLTYRYLDLDMVAMRLGGASTKSIKSIIFDNNKNIVRACRSNGVYTNFFMISFRYIFKIIEMATK
jgi:glycosyltransferase involved in cell wall biosynthesis